MTREVSRVTEKGKRALESSDNLDVYDNPLVKMTGIKNLERY